MKNYNLYFAIFLFFTLLFLSCKKNETFEPACFPNDITTRTIMDKQATVKLVNAKFCIVEQGAIDTKLIPCNLPKEF